jgi:hypothetical protein
VARVVAVHGIANQYHGPAVLHAAWYAPLRDGVTAAGGAALPAEDLACAFYGDLFRGPERVLGTGDPLLEASDVDDGFERELLFAWWDAAAATDPAVVPPDARSLGPTMRGVQAALDALSGSRFFAGLAERALVFSLKQVRAYLQDPQVRSAVLARVAATVTDETRVLVGHSLGSVVGYEALCAHPEWPVRTFVTLGSPLGVRNLIFDRLIPAPVAVGDRRTGQWPSQLTEWTNIADENDVVALVKDLRPRFGDRVRCVLVDTGARAHDVRRYLTAQATGEAIRTGLGADA